MRQLLSYLWDVTDDDRYGIAELADLGGVSRRTVRYYVQEGLLQPPLGVGRGKHYGPEHLERLLQVKQLQQAGHPLDAIRQHLAGGRVAAPAPAAGTPRTAWVRIELAPGLELHVATDRRLPAPGKLAALADLCRHEFPERQ